MQRLDAAPPLLRLVVRCRFDIGERLRHGVWRGEQEPAAVERFRGVLYPEDLGSDPFRMRPAERLEQGGRHVAPRHRLLATLDEDAVRGGQAEPEIALLFEAPLPLDDRVVRVPDELDLAADVPVFFEEREDRAVDRAGEEFEQRHRSAPPDRFRLFLRCGSVHILHVADLVGRDPETHPDKVVVPLLRGEELQLFRRCPERYPGGVGGVHQGEFVGLADDLVFPILPEPGQVVV